MSTIFTNYVGLRFDEVVRISIWLKVLAVASTCRLGRYRARLDNGSRGCSA